VSGLLEQTDVLRGRLLDDILCGVNGSRASYESVRQAAALGGPHGRLSLVAITAVRGAGQQRTASTARDRKPQRATGPRCARSVLVVRPEDVAPTRDGA